MDEKTASTLRKFQGFLKDALLAADSHFQSNSPDCTVRSYQLEVVKRLEKLVQRGQPVLGQVTLSWVQLDSWWSLEGIQDFLHQKVPFTHTVDVRIILSDSVRELGEAVLPAVRIKEYWTLQGVENFLDEKVRLSVSDKIQITLLESP